MKALRGSRIFYLIGLGMLVLWLMGAPVVEAQNGDDPPPGATISPLIPLNFKLPDAPPVAASRIHVDRDAVGANDGTSWADAYTTLQGALDWTNAHGATHYEIWVAEGTYYPDEGGLHVDNAVTETFRIAWNNVQLYGGFAATETQRSQRDWVVHPVILSGDLNQDSTSDQNAAHVFFLDGTSHQRLTSDLLIDGFVITAGNDRSFYCDGGGEGHECSPTLLNLTFSHNNGGGFFCNGGGGGTCQPTLINTLFDGNSAGQGGGMYNNGEGGSCQPRLIDVTFNGNRANSGGAMHNSNGCNPLVIHGTFRENQASIGGAIMNNAAYNGGSGVTLINTVFKGNQAGRNGGAIAAEGTYYSYNGATAINTLFSGNRAGDSGGAFYGEAGTYGGASVTLINTTLSGNSARGGGALDGFYLHNYGSVSYHLINSIVWGNSNPQISGYSDFPQIHHSDIEGGWQGAGNLNVDPRFVAPIAASFAPTTTGDYRLQPGSPAIDAGDTSSAGYDTDPDGNPRVQGAAVDMGAYESQPVLIYVDRNAAGDGDGSSWTDAYTTLQAALDWTNAHSPVTYEIWVAEGTYYPDEGGIHFNDVLTESFQISRNNVELYGGFAATETQRTQRNWAAHPTILNGDLDQDGTLAHNAYHVLYLDGATYEPLTRRTILDGFVITGGNAAGSGGKLAQQKSLCGGKTLSGALHNAGGGLFCAGSAPGGNCSPALAHLVFSGNRAADKGGAIYNEGYLGNSSPTFTDVLFSGNWATSGGAIYNNGAYGASHPAFINVTFSGNQAYYEGGALFNFGACGSSRPILANTLLWGNVAPLGPQLLNNEAAPIITYSDVQGGYPGEHNLDVDPWFIAPLAATSAPTTTGNYRLQVGSPAIDVGNSLSVTLTTDLDNRRRITYRAVDLGAYEVPAPTYLITPTAGPNGVLVPALPQTLDYGDSITFTLIPDPGYQVREVVVDGVSVGAVEQYTFTHVITDHTIAATFTLKEYMLSVTLRGHGRVVREPEQPVYLAGEVVTLTVIPAPHWTFVDWSGDLTGSRNPISLTIQGDVVATANLEPPPLIYVDRDATGTNDGTSWADAYPTLQAALDWTRDHGATPYEIWVAEGTYYPDEGGFHVDNAVTESFTLAWNNVQLYGGFAATETLRSQRDWKAHPTILSGDLDQDGDLYDNAYHVLYVDGLKNQPLTESTVIDGFTITSGLAPLPISTEKSRGGGLHCRDGGIYRPTLANLIFSDNYAYMGGGFYCSQGGGICNPTLTNVIFVNNRAYSYYMEHWSVGGSGAGMYIGGDAMLNNVAFINNIAWGGNTPGRGGGMANVAGSSILINVTFNGNQAGWGPALYAESAGHPIVVNSILWGNGAPGSAPLFYPDYNKPDVTYSDVEGGYPGEGNLNLDPRFIDPAGGNYRLHPNSPVIDAGTNSAVTVTTDLDGRPRIVNGTVDMGAYESAYNTHIITPTAGPHGAIQPGTPRTVKEGGDAVFTLVPDTGYQVLDVAVDGVSVGAMSQYTFTNVQADHTLTAAFTLDEYTLTLAIQHKGRVTRQPDQPTYHYGDVVTLTAVPTAPWTFNNWSGALSGNDNPISLTIQGNTIVTATFEPPSRIYVAYNASGAKDGTSWFNAYSYLQSALDWTNAHGETHYEIWVAQGTYRPDQGGLHINNAVTESFTITWNNVQLYGGFAATETQRDQRDWVAHPTILSGDLDKDGTWAHNAYHVLYLDGATNDPLTATVVLDGFTITWGNASDDGGGLYCQGSGAGHQCSPTLSHLIFTGNRAAERGGGMYDNGRDGGVSSPTLTDVSFHNNQGRWGGGLSNDALNSGDSSPILDRVVFNENRATESGGGIYNHSDNHGSCNLQLNQVDFSDNHAGAGGGMCSNNGYSGDTSSTLTNVTFNHNDAGSGGGMANYVTDNSIDNSRLTHVTFNNNQAGWSGGGMYSVGGFWGDSSPILEDVVFNGNQAEQYGGGMRNESYYSGSAHPILINVVFINNQANQKGGGMHNESYAFASSNPDLTNVTFQGNQAGDGGGMYNVSLDTSISNPSLTNVIFSGNRALNTGGGLGNETSFLNGTSSPMLTNVTFSGNWAGQKGGGLYNLADNPSINRALLVNCILWGNSAPQGSQLYNDNATPIITFSDIQGGWPGVANFDADPRFIAPINASFAPTTTGNYRLQAGSPAIDAGDNSVVTVTTDLDRRPRLVNDVVDLGPYEMAYSTHTITPTAGPHGSIDPGTPRIMNEGSQAAFTIVPDIGYQILDVAADGISVGAVSQYTFTNIQTDHTITAVFTLEEYTLSIAIQNQGSVTRQPDHPTYHYGDVIILTAVPVAPGVFIHWSGDLRGSANPISLTLQGNTIVTATFDVFSRIYVDRDAAGTNDGTSWANAFTQLQSALDWTNTHGATHYEIWVAEGTYYPDEGGSHVNNALTESFTLAWNNIQLYGGFAATETLRDQRDWRAHPTVLSGDLDQDGTWAHNVYHVLYLDGATNEPLTATAVLDGFTITGGNASDDGGGLYCRGNGTSHQCSPTLSHLIFTGNRAVERGGGMYNNGRDGGVSNPALSDVSFHNNQGGWGGGLSNDGINSGDSSPIVDRVVFSENVATESGGGIYNNSDNHGKCNLQLNQVEFNDNRADAGGGMFSDSGYGSNTSSTLIDVTFNRNYANAGGGMANWVTDNSINYSRLNHVTFNNNTADRNGGGICNLGDFEGNNSPVLEDVIFNGNRAGQYGGGMYNASDYDGINNPTLINVIFQGNQASEGGGMYNANNLGASIKPVLTNVIFSGNRAVDNGGGLANNNGYSRNTMSFTLTHVTFSGNRAGQKGGAIYNLANDSNIIFATLVNCILWGNSAPSNPQIYNDYNSITVTYSDIQGSWQGPGNINLDPLFTVPIDASFAPTTTGNYRLQAGSPAIDAGDNSAVTVTTDLDGQPRLVNGTVDMGAYESTYPVKSGIYQLYLPVVMQGGN